MNAFAKAVRGASGSGKLARPRGGCLTEVSQW